MSAPTPSSPGVRRATPDDRPSLRRLQRHLDERAPALLDAALAGTLGECFVAVDETDNPVGYLLAVEGDGGVAASSSALETDCTLGSDTERDTVHLAELVVAPDARRNGHASALLVTLLSTHPTATVTLTVAPENHAARELYERFGFEVCQELPDFFDDGPGRLLARRPRSE